MGMRRVAGLSSNPLPTTVDKKSTGKCTSGMDKFGSVGDRMYMKLESKILSSLRVKTLSAP
jgi:hypothetical protein